MLILLLRWATETTSSHMQEDAKHILDDVNNSWSKYNEPTHVPLL